jgi:pimeloyl-ACP methyl ester carboxylesterase/DNA-binding CsgD family transcriptional regulator
MRSLKQDIRFANTTDGAQIAYAVSGNGYPLVRAAHWLTHVEFDIRTPVWRPWIERLSARFRFHRYDSRGCGLSGPSADATTLDRLVSDLAAVVDAARLERFALFGLSQGGAAAIAYAARHPERVSHLILCGAFVQGVLKRAPTPQQVEAAAAMIKLVEVGWGERNSAYLQMFTSQFFPDATLEQMQSFNEIQRRSTSPANAARIMRGYSELDASDSVALVRAPTLVMHCRGDARAPFEQGRWIAATIAGARFVPLASNNHVPLADEPAFAVALDELERFVGGSAPAAYMDLSTRERAVLDLVARGLDNAQIGAHLAISEKTVRNNITRILDKLGVESRAQAIVQARDAGFGVR